MKKRSDFPPGWDEARVRRVLDHYEDPSDEAAGVGRPANSCSKDTPRFLRH